MTIRNVTEPRRDSLMAATYFLRFGLGALPALLGLADRFLDGLGRFVTNPVQSGHEGYTVLYFVRSSPNFSITLFN